MFSGHRLLHNCSIKWSLSVAGRFADEVTGALARPGWVGRRSAMTTTDLSRTTPEPFKLMSGYSMKSPGYVIAKPKLFVPRSLHKRQKTCADCPVNLKET